MGLDGDRRVMACGALRRPKGWWDSRGIPIHAPWARGRTDLGPGTDCRIHFTCVDASRDRAEICSGATPKRFSLLRAPTAAFYIRWVSSRAWNSRGRHMATDTWPT